MKTTRMVVILTVAFVTIAISCKGEKPPVRKGNVDPADVELPIREILAKYYADRNFFVGASGTTEYMKEETDITRRWLAEFSYSTPTNDAKQGIVHSDPSAGWNIKPFMKHIDLARKNGQVIRCHGAISPQCSRWVREDERTPQELREMLEFYTGRLSQDLQANKDVVRWMDVVNETNPANSSVYGTGYAREHTTDVVEYKEDDWLGPRSGYGKWEFPWTIIGMEQAGPDFQVPTAIKMAFEIANKYAPDIKTIFNSGPNRTTRPVIESIKRAVLWLKSQGIRVDGIGFQCHLPYGWEKIDGQLEGLRSMIDWCHANDLEFHITELDVSVSRQENEINYKALNDTRKEQAETIGAVMEIMLQKIGAGAVAVNFWTMTDHYESTMRATYANLFDDQGNPNPAYYRVKELLIKYAR